MRKRENCTNGITKGAPGVREEKSLRLSISFLTRPSSCQASLKVTLPPLLPLPLATPVKQASYYRTNRNTFKQCIPIFHGLLVTALNNVVSPLEVLMQIHHTVCCILNHLSESSQRVLNQVTQWILEREQTKSWKSPQHVVRWGVRKVQIYYFHAASVKFRKKNKIISIGSRSYDWTTGEWLERHRSLDQLTRYFARSEIA